MCDLFLCLFLHIVDERNPTTATLSEKAAEKREITETLSFSHTQTPSNAQTHYIKI